MAGTPINNIWRLLLLKVPPSGVRGLLWVFCLLFFACSSDSQYDTSHKCYLVIDNSIHLDPTLMSCMNSMSPGVFCRVSLGAKNGVPTYFVESNQINGETKQQMKSSFTLNDVDRQRTKLLGIYNESGLIVGFGNLDNPPVFYAYDALCPNCYEVSMPGCYKPMTMNSVGIASCSLCRRTYNLNTGGNIVSGESGRQLYRYRATTSGPQGILMVRN